MMLSVELPPSRVMAARVCLVFGSDAPASTLNGVDSCCHCSAFRLSSSQLVTKFRGRKNDAVSFFSISILYFFPSEWPKSVRCDTQSVPKEQKVTAADTDETSPLLLWMELEFTFHFRGGLFLGGETFIINFFFKQSMNARARIRTRSRVCLHTPELTDECRKTSLRSKTCFS